MQQTIDFINQNLTKQQLEKISVAIIDAYKHGNQMLLRTYAQLLLGASASTGKDKKVLFFQIIKLIHPDRLSVLSNEFKQAKEKNDTEKLGQLKTLLSVQERVIIEKKARFDYSPAEEYGYDASAYDESAFDEFSFNEEEVEDVARTVREEASEYSFMDALRSQLFGNLDLDISPLEMGHLDGCIDVSQFDLYELDGLQHCINITELNLSHNEIDNIFQLQYLVSLQELYLSDNQVSNIDYLANLQALEIIDLENNEIEDIGVLPGLDKLKLVNLRGNPNLMSSRKSQAKPNPNQKIIEELKERGVTVLY